MDTMEDSDARAYLERHLANLAAGRGGLVPARVAANVGACEAAWGLLLPCWLGRCARCVAH